MSKRRSVMTNRFSQVPSVEIPRSSFDRSHGLKTTLDEGGFLYPILVDEALPGDTFNVRMNAFARLATPIKPIMDNMFMETFFFAIPVRLLWDNWVKMNGEQDKPSDSTDFTVPTFPNAEGITAGTLHDYMGVPTGVTNLPISSLYARSYGLVWNEWFRDQNLQDSLDIPTGDDAGIHTADVYQLQRRNKRHDYFTSALPWPQKGDAITLPLGSSAPVNPITPGVAPQFRAGSAGSSNISNFRDAGNQGYMRAGSPTTEGATMFWGNQTGLETDLSSATAATINDLRLGFQLQRLLERDARGGTRYTEILRSHFGVTSPDARLQRPEFLGGGSSYININPVAQTEATPTSQSHNQTASTPQGNLSAIGVTSLTGHGFTKSFTEHSIILGLVNVRADLTYQQGLNRMWSRQSRFDFYWPSLAHLGEQQLLQKEIYASGTTEDDNKIFGYQEAFAEYRYKPSLITGKMRSNDPQTLDIWHLSQNFGSAPTLSSSFIEDKPPIERVVAVPSEPKFLFDAHFTMKCARPMPLYGVPGLIDHF